MPYRDEVDESKLWNSAFSTPMMTEAFAWATDLIAGGHTGGVLYAPTRTGKTKTIELLVEELRSFDGPRSKLESATAWVVTQDRLVMSEGGFWDWLLSEFKHQAAGAKKSPGVKRQLVIEYVKSLARSSPSGRLVLFVDEAQILELTELGWFADLFNSLQKVNLELILFLVGSYHLREWIKELEGKRHEHVRSRFFTKEHRLRGLKTLTDFKRCLRRFDVDTKHLESGQTITQFYLPEWYAGGGRLEERADLFREGFRAVSPLPDFEVPMAYFVRAVRKMLNDGTPDCEFEEFKSIVVDTGYPKVKLTLDGLPA